MRTLAALTLCAVLLALPARAGADGDPASDVLLVQNVFYPYQPRVSHALEAAMSRTLQEAAAGGLRLKVAIILQQYELGLVPQFYGHPQAYAQFLDREISFNRAQPLLTVMPAGFGVVSAGAARAALASVPLDRRQRSYGLTRSAILAVAALARADGHPIPSPSIPSAGPAGGSGPAALIFALPLAVLALGALLLVRRGHRRAT